MTEKRLRAVMLTARTTTTWLLAFLFVLASLARPSALAAQQKHLQLKWSELAQVISGQKVAMALPSVKHIEGEVLAVEPDALVLNISRTSDGRAYPKGRASIPRSQISVLNLTEKGGHRWRVTGTAIGAGAGLLAGWGVALLISADERPRPAATAAFVLITGGLATAGYFAGRGADRRITTIIIAP